MNATTNVSGTYPSVARLVDEVEDKYLASIHFNWSFLVDAAFTAVQRHQAETANEVIDRVRQVAEGVRRYSGLDSDVLRLHCELTAAMQFEDLPLVSYLLGQTREAVLHLQMDFYHLPVDRRRAALDAVTSLLGVPPNHTEGRSVRIGDS